MTKKELIRTYIEKTQSLERRTLSLESNGISLIEYEDEFYKFISILSRELFTEQEYEEIEWWLYDSLEGNKIVSYEGVDIDLENLNDFLDYVIDPDKYIKEKTQKAVEVYIYHNNEAGVKFFSIADYNNEENWLNSFTTFDKAVKYCKKMNYTIIDFKCSIVDCKCSEIMRSSI